MKNKIIIFDTIDKNCSRKTVILWTCKIDALILFSSFLLSVTYGELRTWEKTNLFISWVTDTEILVPKYPSKILNKVVKKITPIKINREAKTLK